MDEEALEVLPRVLEAIGFQRGLLFGHSDGASIATMDAGSVQDHRVRGLVLLAPDFFTDEMGIAELSAPTTVPPPAPAEKLARWHSDVDCAFRSWIEPWLIGRSASGTSPERWADPRAVLVVQGAEDEYGTLRQVEAVREECFCPVEAVTSSRARHLLSRCAGDDAAAAADFMDRLSVTTARANDPRIRGCGLRIIVAIIPDLTERLSAKKMVD